MPENNYFFVDGSCLLSDIASIKSGPEFTSKKLDIIKFAEIFAGILTEHLHSGFYKRFVVYFVEHENRIDNDIILPPFDQPGVVNDLQIRTCGKRIRWTPKFGQVVKVGFCS